MGKAAAKRAAARAGSTQRGPVRPPSVRRDPSGWEQPRADVLVDALGQLQDLQRKRAEIGRREVELVDALRRAGAPWRMVGDALGVSPQAAQQRFAVLGLGRDD